MSITPTRSARGGYLIVARTCDHRGNVAGGTTERIRIGMNTAVTRASIWVRAWRRSRRVLLAAMAGAVLLGGAATPALAEPVLIDVEVSAALMTPVSIMAGEEATVKITVQPQALGAQPIEGGLVGLAVGSEIIAFGQLDAAGEATVSVRPTMPTMLWLTPVFLEDGAYAGAVGEDILVLVGVPGTATELVLDLSYGTPTAFGGGQLFVVASVQSQCEADAASDAEAAACVFRYGYPEGTISIRLGLDEVATIPVSGSNTGGAAFAALDADLGEGVDPTTAGVGSAYIPVPDLLLGSPDSVMLAAVFTPSNWFGLGVDFATVDLRASATSVEVFVGDDLLNPQHTVYGDKVTLVAFVTAEDYGAAEPDGTVQFFEGGVAISGQVPLVDGTAAAFDWVPTVGTGEYEITAVFTPATLNHEASESEGYPLTVVVTPAPNPNPGGSEGGGNGAGDGGTGEKPVAENGKSGEVLAKTGAGSTAAVGFAGMLAAATGLMLVAGAFVANRARRRVS